MPSFPNIPSTTWFNSCQQHSMDEVLGFDSDAGYAECIYYYPPFGDNHTTGQYQNREWINPRLTGDGAGSFPLYDFWGDGHTNGMGAYACGKYKDPCIYSWITCNTNNCSY